MLQNTFIHIPRVGKATEGKLWERGVTNWTDYKKATTPLLKGKHHITTLDFLTLSEEKLAQEDSFFFFKNIPSSDHWRLFGDFNKNAAYLDIETTGLETPGDHITTIALYAEGQVFYYVYGDNLDNFPKDIQKYSLIVTYNGKCFDIPFIEKYFNINLNKAHIDLRFVLASLGYKGGLKGCEKQLGISRGDLEGVDGYFAVLLWQEYKKNGNQKALETLLAYNIEDTVNLEKLMYIAYNEKLEFTPFKQKELSFKSTEMSLPFQADFDTVEEIKRKYFYYSA